MIFVLKSERIGYYWNTKESRIEVIEDQTAHKLRKRWLHMLGRAVHKQ